MSDVREKDSAICSFFAKNRTCRFVSEYVEMCCRKRIENKGEACYFIKNKVYLLKKAKPSENTIYFQTVLLFLED